MPRPASTYHTHTSRCRHASGDVVDYARAARAAGLARLGASDHSPMPDGRWGEVRMRLDELAGYEAAVAEARREVPEVEILLGMECDLDPELFPWYRDTFAARGYDLLIGSVHYVHDGSREVSAFTGSTTAAALADYARRVAAAAASGLFACIGHPDNLAACHDVWTPDLAAWAADVCAAAVAHRIPLELNALGLRERRGYPWRPFWEIAAAHGCTAVLASDAHHPAHTAAGLDELAAFAGSLALPVVDLDALRAGR